METVVTSVESSIKVQLHVFSEIVVAACIRIRYLARDIL